MKQRFAKDPGQNENRNEKHHASDMIQIVEQDLHPETDLVYIKMEAQSERNNISSLKCENILPSLTFFLVTFLQLCLFLGARTSIPSYAVWESQQEHLKRKKLKIEWQEAEEKLKILSNEAARTYESYHKKKNSKRLLQVKLSVCNAVHGGGRAAKHLLAMLNIR